MNKILLLLFASSLASAQTYEEYKAHFILEEGVRNSVYVDSLGYKTIGIGHKLLPHELDISYLNDDGVDNFFRIDLQKAISDARSLVPNFDKHNAEVKILLVSMAFNLGHSGFSKFVKFRKAIGNNNYDVAAAELLDSKWARQVPNRARRAVFVLTKAAIEP